MDKLTIIKVLNDTRKANKGRWYSGCIVDDAGRSIEYKGYNTWLQIFRIDGVTHSSLMDISVKQFNEFLSEVL